MPWAAVSIGASSTEELVKIVSGVIRKYDERVLVEARLDYLPEPLKALRALSPFSSRLIVTYRRPEEGGASKSYDIGGAREIFEEAAKLAPRFIDVELRTLMELKVDFRDLIASIHYVGTSPSEREMLEDARVARGLAPLVKLVVHPKTFEEAVRPLSLYRSFKRGELIAFSAGDEWKFTRFLALALGSPIIYCSLPGRSVAPGQPIVDEALTLMEAIS